jgi:hypothetical protein
MHKMLMNRYLQILRILIQKLYVRFWDFGVRFRTLAFLASTSLYFAKIKQ